MGLGERIKELQECANRYREEKEFSHALTEYNTLLSLFPDNAQFHTNAGICYYGLNAIELAEESFQTNQ